MNEKEILQNECTEQMKRGAEVFARDEGLMAAYRDVSRHLFDEDTYKHVHPDCFVYTKMRAWLGSDLGSDAVVIGASLFQRCIDADHELRASVDPREWFVQDRDGEVMLRSPPIVLPHRRERSSSESDDDDSTLAHREGGTTTSSGSSSGVVTSSGTTTTSKYTVSLAVQMYTACLVMGHKLFGQPYNWLGYDFGCQTAILDGIVGTACGVSDIDGWALDFRVMKTLQYRLLKLSPDEDRLPPLVP